MNISLPIGRRLFLSHFLAVLLVSGSVGTFFYMTALRSLVYNLQVRLQNSAALVSQVLDAADLHGIRSPADVSRPEYGTYLQRLRDFRRTNPDIAFLYLMRREGDRVVFVVDSDETPAQALPGREYTSVVPALLEGFSRPSVDKEVQTDEWGAFMSGYSPIRNGGGQYLVGIDMRATEVQEKLRVIRLSGLASLLFSVLLALLFSRVLSWHFRRPIDALISRCSAIAHGLLDERLDMRTGDDFDDLVQAFNTMSTHLSESREMTRRAEEALRQANEALEGRVQERTRDLSEVNDRLLHEVSERQKVEEALALAAKTDSLTGLLNRRAVLEHLEYQIVRFKRNRVPFVVLMCDLDLFKRVNDSHGHDAGDRILKAVAGALVAGCRGQDLVARWGGEEFLLVLPDTDLQGGLLVGEKVRARVYQLTSPELDGAPLTMSVGVTVYAFGLTPDDCIKRADRALYEAKHLGRNCVVAAR